jgi:hypothetical protein
MLNFWGQFAHGAAGSLKSLHPGDPDWPMYSASADASVSESGNGERPRATRGVWVLYDIYVTDSQRANADAFRHSHNQPPNGIPQELLRHVGHCRLPQVLELPILVSHEGLPLLVSAVVPVRSTAVLPDRLGVTDP